MNSHLMLAAATAFLLVSLVVFLTRQFRSPLRTVKGPFLARLSSAWYAFKVWQGSFQEVNLELHNKHGMCYQETSVIRRGLEQLSRADLHPQHRQNHPLRPKPLQHQRSRGRQADLRAGEPLSKVPMVHHLVQPRAVVALRGPAHAKTRP